MSKMSKMSKIQLEEEIEELPLYKPRKYEPFVSGSKADDELYIFMLPTYGEPYITATIKEKEYKKEAGYKLLRKLVRGCVLDITSDCGIHSLFIRESKRWEIIHKLKMEKSVKVYGDADGQNKGLTPNMATYAIDYYKTEGKVFQYPGDMVVVVSYKILKKHSINIDSFTVIKPYESFNGDEYPFWEFEDENNEALEEMEEEFKAMGFDYNDFLYKAKV